MSHETDAEKDEAKAQIRGRVRAGAKQTDKSKIEAEDVNQDNYGAYLVQEGFPTEEWKKIKDYPLAAILASEKSYLEAGLKSCKVDDFYVGIFIEAVRQIPGSKLNDSQSGVSAFVCVLCVMLQLLFCFVSSVFFILRSLNSVGKIVSTWKT